MVVIKKRPYVERTRKYKNVALRPDDWLILRKLATDSNRSMQEIISLLLKDAKIKE